MKELGISGQCYGDMSFETLALAGSMISVRHLIFIDNVKYVPSDMSDKVVLTDPEIAETIDANGVCACENPRIAFFKIHNYLSEASEYKRPRFDTRIGNNCKISRLACISENNVEIGHNVIIEEFVSIKENTVIGDNCVIRAGSVIGGEGFEYKREGDEILSVKHLGGVRLGNNVELQQLTAVDKAIYPWDDTVIGDFCKTDNMVHIAHAVKMGKRVLIAACALIAGRVVLRDDVWIGPGVTATNGISVGDNARVNIGSVITRDVPDGGSVTGNFAIEHSKFIRNLKEWNRD